MLIFYLDEQIISINFYLNISSDSIDIRLIKMWHKR